MNTSITGVVVYPDRARLTRRGETALKEGVHNIEITDLSIHLDPDSLRATARGSARARILGLQVQKRFHQQTPAGYVRDLEGQLEKASDELKRTEAQIDLINDQKNKLKDLSGHTGIYARALAKRELDIETQMTLFDGLRTRAERLEAEVLSLLNLKREQSRKVQKLKKQLDQVHGAKPSERYSAVVEIEVLQPGELAIELVYIVRSAGWKPIYDIRLVDDASGVRLDFGFMAQISQRSGENWGGVALTLSTARPALNNILPELDPWYISPRPKPVPRSIRSGIDRLSDEMQPAMLSAVAPPDKSRDELQEIYEAEYATATIESSWTAVSYQVPGKVVIPTDGEPHKVTIARVALPAETDYISAPKIVPAVYRRASVKNDSPFTLLPGVANLFAGDEYIGATNLDLIAPQGKIELYLGVDDRVVIHRELKKRDIDKALIGGKRRLHYGYQIEVENNTGRDIYLAVKDQIPVSRHEDIKIKLDTAKPAPDKHDELNLLEWKLHMHPTGKAQLRYDFDVEHPSDMEVVGLT